ncbi:hypothetical protein AB0K16_27470 [Nonomuraea jabiensis]|uniref:Uncharacterized protein n=1 Tax=Nonomuraea jabiensis TaxID=882448 RepID=A0A7W9GJR0_9ACTN|nr:hypothetical protein [Nonomuraea jabiensis]MBB5785104.1 hypothetical protein [Nonomuraea jabiensis]
MLTDEQRRSQPHEVHARGARHAPPPSWGEDQGDAPVEAPRTVHRLRRIRPVPVRPITEIDHALRHPVV